VVHKVAIRKVTPVVHKRAVHKAAPVVHRAPVYKAKAKAKAKPIVKKVTTCKQTQAKVITRTLKVRELVPPPAQGFPWWAVLIGGAGAIALRKLIVGLVAWRKNKSGDTPEPAAN